jgi:hypothetical protein
MHSVWSIVGHAWCGVEFGALGAQDFHQCNLGVGPTHCPSRRRPHNPDGTNAIESQLPWNAPANGSTTGTYMRSASSEEVTVQQALCD